MPDIITMMGVDGARAAAIVHGLAYMRTLMNAAKVGENYDNIFYVPEVQELQPSSLSIGENYNHQSFVKWVHDEEMRLYQRFDVACDGGKQTAWDWLGSARQAAYEYQQNFRTMCENLNATNKRMSDALTFSVRASATTQAVAEIALTVVGLFGAAAGASVAAVGGSMVPTASLALNTAAAGMTLKLGLEKMAVGVAGSLTISVAETWNAGRTADVWVVPMNVPGAVSDCFNDFLKMRNLKLTKAVQVKLGKTPASDAAGYAARQALLNQKALLRKPIQTGTIGVVATGAAYVFAAWSIKDSLVKLYNRW